MFAALRNKYLHHIYIALTHLLSTNLALNRGHHLKFGAEISYTMLRSKICFFLTGMQGPQCRIVLRKFFWPFVFQRKDILPAIFTAFPHHRLCCIKTIPLQTDRQSRIFFLQSFHQPFGCTLFTVLFRDMFIFILNKFCAYTQNQRAYYQFCFQNFMVIDGLFFAIPKFPPAYKVMLTMAFRKVPSSTTGQYFSKNRKLSKVRLRIR